VPHKELPEAVSRQVEMLRAQQARDGRIVASPRDVGLALGVGPTRVRDLLAAGALRSVLDGRLRRILVSSVYDYLVERTISSRAGEQRAHEFRGLRPTEKAARRKRRA
jgi:hypothetical protein